MAQTGYTPILIYASGTATNVPLAANLTSSASGAELALNYADGKLYYKNSSGVVTLLASAAGAAGDVVGPASATDNALARFDTTTGKLIQNSVGILSDAGVLTGLTGLTSSGNVTLSSLTSGRVPYATTAGLLTDSANLLYSGTDLTVYGITVGRGAGAVSTNTAVGNSALVANTTGATNTAFGASALAANTTGYGNTAVGREAMVYNITGLENVAVGVNTLWANTAGTQNTAVGWSALFSNTTADYNTAVGSAAGYALTTGTQNTAIGSQALRVNATGSYNTALGYNALRNSTASGNTAIGYSTLTANTTGIENVAVGGSGIATATLVNNTSGSYNVAVGNGALASNTTASNNIAIGYQAAYNSSTAIQTVAIGTQALATNTNANSNTAVGHQAGYLTTGGSNTLLGRYAGYAVTTGTTNTYVGDYSGANNGNSAASNNVGVGGYALNAVTTGAGNVAVGMQAMLSTTTASNNVAIGKEALYLNTVGSGYVAVGYYALRAVNTSSGYATGVGYGALQSNTTGFSNTAVGDQSLQTNTTGVGNVSVGSLSLLSSTTANYNTAVGYEAIRNSTTGTQITAIGYQSARAATANYGTFLGAQTGAESTGQLNTFVGWASGYLMTTGSKNTILGGYNGNQDSLDIRTSSNVIVLSDGDGNANFVVRRNSGGGYFFSGPTKTDPSGGNYYSTISSAGSDVQLILQRVGDAGAGYGGIGASSTAAFLVYGQGLSSTPFRVNQTDGTVILKNGNQSATGTGVTFPSTQTASSDANTLDDYEEGTWTPNIFGTSTTGTQSGTRAGTYVKIGRFVYLHIQLTAFTLSGAAGNIVMSGLPYSVTNLGGMSIYLEGLDPVYSGTPDDKITLTVQSLNSTTVSFRPSVSNGWDSYMTASTTWTGGGGATYGSIAFWAIAES
jgi:hypothetical protein